MPEPEPGPTLGTIPARLDPEDNMRRLATAATVAAAASLVCACSSTKHTASSTPPTSGPSASSAPGGGSSPSAPGATIPPTTILASSVHALNEPVSVAGGSLDVFSYTAPATPNVKSAKPAPAGKSYAVVDVQSCVGASGGASAGPADFVLQLTDGSQTGPRVGVRDPAFVILQLKANACTRGFITFSIPAGARATQVLYAPSGAAWRVS
jgi:hypothetical protein